MAKDRRSGKQMTLAQRVKIESLLNDNFSYAKIGRAIGKAGTTVMREINRNCVEVPAKRNICMLQGQCQVKRLCERRGCKERCSRRCGDHCFDLCDMYQPYLCERMKQAPYICNGCGNTLGCRLDKRFYRAKDAHDKAMARRVESRDGFDLTEEELALIDEVASPRLKKGQSPFHVLESCPELNISESTLYRLIDRGLLSASNTDLKQKLRRKPRKRVHGKLHNEGGVSVRKAGRMYEDFLAYIEETESAFVEMDCVEGKFDDRQALLTLHFTDLQMQLAFYLQNHDSAHVLEVFDKIERALGLDLFREAFPVILTDNGPEFSNFKAMETSCLSPGQKRTKVFFCDPNRSDQKGACENNHKLIRYIIPKGTSLMPLIQSDITLMMNHINSYRRKKSRGLAPYDLAMQALPQAFFTALKLERIPDEEVILNPVLLENELMKRTVKYNYSKI